VKRPSDPTTSTGKARHTWRGENPLSVFRGNPAMATAVVTTGDLLAILFAWLASRAELGGRISPLAVGIVAIVHQLVLSGTGLHTQLRMVSAASLFRRVVGSWLHTVLALGVIALLKPDWTPPAAALDFAILFFFALLFVRFATMLLRHGVRRHGRNLRYVLIAGTGEMAAQIDGVVTANPGWGLRVVGFLDSGCRPAADAALPEDRICGSFADLERVVRERVVDEVMIADPEASMGVVGALVAISRTLGLRTHIVASFLPGPWLGVDVQQILDNILLSLTPYSRDLFGLSLKRLVDLVGSACALIVLSPLFLILAVLVKLDSRGPVFFRERRVGLNGRVFVLRKFRSMCRDAAAQVEALSPRNEMDGPVFKMRDDPRVTRVGRWLRRFSLDEIPQLWNVLKGDMSLVGPRPLRPHEIAGHLAWQRRRLSMRPGLTCLWQVSGRNLIGFEQWMRLDLQYIDSWSMGLDLRILAQTLPAVILGRGAS